MNAVLWTWMMLAAADDLVPAHIQGLQIRVPAAWKQRAENGTRHYEAPSEDAAFEISVFPVTPERDGKICLKQLMAAVAGKGWERISVGGAPAARKTSTDVQIPDAGPRKEFTTHSYLGCNGSTKWLFTLTHQESKRSRFEPLAQTIAHSVQYAKGQR